MSWMTNLTIFGFGLGDSRPVPYVAPQKPTTTDSRAPEKPDHLDELNKLLSELENDRGLETSGISYGATSFQVVVFAIREILRLRKETAELEQRVKTLEES